MKGGIHKRLYNVLPVRARAYYTSPPTVTSTSLSFFDSPPPPPSRLPAREPKHHSHPNPLALTPSPLPDHDYPQLYNQCQSLSLPPSLSPSPNSTTSTTTSSLHNKPTRLRYQLDVGAYGIPKRCRTPKRSFDTDDASLAVSIGEDAYFIRDNAMGVADGVGGWARNCLSTSSPLDSPSPSALFARRLMHYTSGELSLPSTRDSGEDCDSESELESHLSELSEGIDVLQILERAYERTVNAHVQPQHNTPLHTGSSTALVAVLDHVHVTSGEGTSPMEGHSQSSTLEQNSTGSSPESRGDPEVKLESPASPVPVVKIAHIGDCMGMLVRGEEIVWRSEEMWWAFNTPVQLAPPPRPPRPSSTPPMPSSTLSSLLSGTSFLFPSPSPSPPRSPSPQSRLYSASPTPRRSPTPLITPRTTAHLVTLPVHANDILILASDGLSDNLWDEDVLDEVVRFKRTCASSEVQPDDSFETRKAEPAGLTMETATSSTSPSSTVPMPRLTPTADAVRRHSLASMLSEALCSRARRISERRTSPDVHTPGMVGHDVDEDEIPFARRAREAGKTFRGGKRDDISVLVAVISPALTSTTLNLN